MTTGIATRATQTLTTLTRPRTATGRYGGQLRRRATAPDGVITRARARAKARARAEARVLARATAGPTPGTGPPTTCVAGGRKVEDWTEIVLLYWIWLIRSHAIHVVGK